MSTKHASKKYAIAIALAFIAWSPALVVPAAHAQSIATLTLDAAGVSRGSGDDGVVPAAQGVPDKQGAPAQARAALQLSKLPLDFIENRGQWETPTKFAAQKGAMATAFELDAIRLLIEKDRPISLGLIFERASKDAGLVGEGKRSGNYNYFIGNDPKKWRAQVAAYSSVLYRGAL